MNKELPASSGMTFPMEKPHRRRSLASILKTMTDLNVSLIEGAHYMQLFITECDAAIRCFKAKYTYNLGDQ
jgi:hypothetical protein